MAQSLKNFMDSEGRLKQWPVKYSLQCEAVALMAEKFEYDRDYTEHEVNSIIALWHTFDDINILRRSLVEYGYLARERDGSRYWKVRREAQ